MVVPSISPWGLGEGYIFILMLSHQLLLCSSYKWPQEKTFLSSRLPDNTHTFFVFYAFKIEIFTMLLPSRLLLLKLWTYCEKAIWLEFTSNGRLWGIQILPLTRVGKVWHFKIVQLCGGARLSLPIPHTVTVRERQILWRVRSILSVVLWAGRSLNCVCVGSYTSFRRIVHLLWLPVIFPLAVLV